MRFPIAIAVAVVAMAAVVSTHTPTQTQATTQTPAPGRGRGQQPVWPVVQGDYVIHDFTFNDGETIPELRLHYRTLGTLKTDAAGHATNAVYIMHGTTGDGTNFLVNQFAGQLFGPGQLLDITKYFLVLPDGIGHGQSSKPSDGLHAKFPKYGYRDMIERRSHGCSPTASRSITCGSSWARRWAGCTRWLWGEMLSGLHGRRRCRWRACPGRFRAAIASGAS